jgi:hypothetical protein
MNLNEKQQGIADAARARQELYGTLSQLKVRLNYAQRVDDAVDEARLKLAEQKRKNPVAFAVGVVGAAAVAGAIVWGVASAVSRRFGS